MIRNALSLCIAVGILGLGACEKHSSASLPDRYKHKAGEAAHADHKAEAAHSAMEKGPAAGH